LGESQVIPLQFQVERLQKELEVVSAHKTWLNSQWQEVTDQLTQTRQANAVEVADLRSSVLEAQQDQEGSAKEVTRLQERLTSLEQKNERLSIQLKDVQTNAVQLKVEGEEELQAAQRLIQLQKTQLERLQGKHDTVAAQLESVQRHALEAEEETSQSMQRQQRELEIKSKQILEQQAQAYQQQVVGLEDQLASTQLRLKEAEDGLLLIKSPRALTAGTNRRPPLALRNDANNDKDDGHQGGYGEGENHEGSPPFPLTEAYIRLAEVEDQLSAEHLRRKKAEITLQRIEAEMVAAAPQLLRQRQEYEDAMERESTFRQRLDAALDEAQISREEAKQIQTELNRLQSRNQELEEETQELAKQVQTLLVSRSTNVGAFGAPAVTGTSGSEPSWSSPSMPTHTPEVIQMQQTNQKLAGQVRTLTREVQDLQRQLESDGLRQKVDMYEEELSTLREERKRQEVLATSLAQQRDLYRALLAKHDVGEDTTAIEMVKRHSERNKLLEQTVGELEGKLASAQGQLSTVDQDKAAASDRIARYEELNKELSTALDRSQSQVSQLHADVARAQAEVTFYQTKVERLDDSLEQSKNEAQRISSAKAELQRLNGELQASLSKTNAEASRYESELNQAKRLARLADTQKEQAVAAEQRLTEENNHLRTSLARQGALMESIQRIEISLSAKAAAEEESFKAQVAALTEKLTTVESQSGAKIDILNGKLSESGEVIKDLENQRTQAANTVAEAKQEAMKFLNELQTANQKCSLLESQLRTAKRKLGDTSDEDVEGDLKSQITSLTEELKSSRKEVDQLKERCSIFEKLAKDNETALADQTMAMNTASEAHGNALAALQTELDEATTHSSKTKEIITELTNDLASQRDERAKELEKMDKRIQELQAQSDVYQKDAESAQNRYAQLEAEVLVLRTDVISAQTNYERELTLHAGARSDLRAAKEAQESELRLRTSAAEQVESLKAELQDQLTMFETEKSQLTNREREYEKTLKDTRAQNTILHDQLEKINEQIGRIQSAKGGTITGEMDSTTEAASLQTTNSELREVVKFLRAEKDMVQNQLDSARRAVERERAAAAVAKRSLEEARAELHVVQESGGRSENDSDDLKQSLKNAEHQLKILGESNAHLREEVTKLESKLSSVASELDASKAASVPSEQRLKDLETEKAGYLAEKSSLLREIDDWKGRVKSLVSKFNQVDPAEHATLQKQAKGLEEQVKTLESQKVEAEQECTRIRTLTTRVSKELTQSKALIELHKKTIASLTEAKETLEKAQNDVTWKKDMEDLKEKLAKLETERSNEKIQLAGAQEMCEKLRDRLRAFQKIISESKQKENNLEKELKEIREELEKAKKAVVLSSTTSESVAVAPEPKASPKVAEKANEDKPMPILPKETPKEMAPPKLTAKKPETTPVPTVPPGGFKFAPSPAETKKSDLDPQPQTTNKRLADSTDDSVATKKAKTPGGSESIVEITKSKDQEGTSQDGPSQAAEDIMKEKLLEKKRKLAMAIEKKKQRAMEASSSSTIQAELSPMKPKIEISPVPTAKKSRMEAGSAPEMPGATEEVAKNEPEDGNATQKTPGGSEGPTEAVEDKGKPEEIVAVGAAVAALPSGEAKINPFAAPATPFGVSSTTSHGLLSGGGSFGGTASAALGPTTFGATSSTSSAIGFGSTSGSGVAGFGGVPPSGPPSSTGFGATLSAGFGTASSAGFGAASSTGFGGKPSTGFGIASSSGFGSTGSAGFGSPASAGFGSSSSSFLNMKPPGSSSTVPTFSFGSSTSIVLPTPSAPAVARTNPFGAFSSTAQAQPTLAAMPLFGTTQEDKAPDGAEEIAEEDEEEGEVEDDGEQALG